MKRNADPKEKAIVCPFFKWTDNNHIACEGVETSSSVSLNFNGRGKVEAYKERFCRDIDGYRRCRFCKMLLEKYADDGK
jgi:hypothetical protein